MPQQNRNVRTRNLLLGELNYFERQSSKYNKFHITSIEMLSIGNYTKLFHFLIKFRNQKPTTHIYIINK